MKKIITLCVAILFYNGLSSQVFNPYAIVDGRMPIFDDLFSNVATSPALDNIITESFYNQLFSERGNNFYSPQAPANPPFTNISVPDVVMGKQVTHYKHFKMAVNYMYSKGGIYAKLFNEGSQADIKRELAAIAAHVWQETRGFSFNSEQGYHPLYDTFAYNGYHGRGPKQISYNYNYSAFSNFFFGSSSNVFMNGGKYRYPVDNTEYDIGPGALAVDGRIAWIAAFWFYLTPQYPKPSMHDVIIAAPGTLINGKPVGFGVTTLIINGGVECGLPAETTQSLNRIGYYNSFLNILGVSDNRQKTCNNLTPFTATLNINEIDAELPPQIVMFPNPTSGIMKVRFTSKARYQLCDIELFENSGRSVFKKLNISLNEEISIQHLPPASYVAKISQNGEVIFSGLITKI